MLLHPRASTDTSFIPVELEAKMLEVATTLLNLDAAEADPRVVKFAPTYKLVFSLLNQDASTGGALLNWEIESLLSSTFLSSLAVSCGRLPSQPLVAEHLRPLLNSLALLHNFSIETQVQYFAPLTISINEDGNGTAIDEDELRAFVNAADWNLRTSVMLAIGVMTNSGSLNSFEHHAGPSTPLHSLRAEPGKSTDADPDVRCVLVISPRFDSI